MQETHKPAQTKSAPRKAEALAPRTSWRGVARRAILCATCAATAATLMFPSASFAAEWVQVGEDKYETAAGDEEGTWSWDGKDDMQLNGYNGSGISAAGRLDLTYTGDNTVTNPNGYGVDVVDGEDEKAELNVSGDGSLEIKSEKSAVACDGDLSISGDGSVTTEAERKVIYSRGDLSISGGTVSANGEGSSAIYAAGDISIQDASVTANSHAGIYSKGSMSIKDSEVKSDSMYEGLYSSGNLTIDNSTVEASGTISDENPKYAAFGIADYGGDITIKNGSLVKALAKSNGTSIGIYSHNAGTTSGGHITISDSTVTAVGESSAAAKFASTNDFAGIGIWAETNDESTTPASIGISRSNVNATGTNGAMKADGYSWTSDNPALGTITIKDSTLTDPQGARLAEFKVTISGEDEGTDSYVEHGTTFVVSGLSPDGVITDLDALEDAAIRKVTIEADKEASPEIKPASDVTPASQPGEKKAIPQTGDANAASLFASAIAGASALAAGLFTTRKREN